MYRDVVRPDLMIRAAQAAYKDVDIQIIMQEDLTNNPTVQKRVEDLALKTMVGEKIIDNRVEHERDISDHVWKLADKMKTHRILPYKRNEAIKAANFLEMTAMYVARLWVNTKEAEVMFKRSIKAMHQTEQIVKLLEGKPKKQKAVLKSHIKTLEILMGKLLTTGMDDTHKRAFAKQFEKAFKILKSYNSQL
ncbi:MAG: hypothetical protein H7A37_03870 [Chlamydiales bacterium]|nr:hypothetical protein [Chlamydiia bacterium]MCP5507424.1 hypothetical protein [Chlamydiales bacterium]